MQASRSRIHLFLMLITRKDQSESHFRPHLAVCSRTVVLGVLLPHGGATVGYGKHPWSLWVAMVTGWGWDVESCLCYQWVIGSYSKNKFFFKIKIGIF